MSTISLNSSVGVLAAEIEGENGTYEISKARVPETSLFEDTILSLDKPYVPPTTMDKVLEVVGYIFYYLLFPVTYPVKLLIDFLIKISIFPGDLYRTDFGVWILKTFTHMKNLEADRINETKLGMKMIGGEISKVETKDGQEIEVMRITQEKFKESIENASGTFADYEVALDDKDALHYFASGKTKKTHTLRTIEFRQNPNPMAELLKKMGWQEVTIETDLGPKKVLQFHLRLGKEESSNRGVVLRCHPMSHFYPFEKKYLINHLAMGKDIVFFDSRGLSKTEYAPSEEGLYFDADAVYRKMRDDWGYKGNDIWVTSRCSGSTQASFLRHRYQEDGVNIVFENGFKSYTSLVSRQFWPVNWMGLKRLECIESQDPKTVLLASGDVSRYVDHFDNIRKLEAMPRNSFNGSRVIVLSTDTDKTVEPDAGQALARAAARTAETYYLRYRGKSRCTDGHFEDMFLKDEKLFASYSQIMSDRGVQYLSNFRGDVLKRPKSH